MLETLHQWSVYGFTFANYLAELGPDAQTEVYNHSSGDRAMRDAFRKMRRFLMTVHKLSEDESISLVSVAADFTNTQLSMEIEAFTEASPNRSLPDGGSWSTTMSDFEIFQARSFA